VKVSIILERYPYSTSVCRVIVNGVKEGVDKMKDQIGTSNRPSQHMTSNYLHTKGKSHVIRFFNLISVR